MKVILTGVNGATWKTRDLKAMSVMLAHRFLQTNCRAFRDYNAPPLQNHRLIDFRNALEQTNYSF